MPDSTFQIRLAAPSDLHNTLALVAQLWAGDTVETAAMQRTFLESLNDEKRRYWVAACDGSIIGFGSLSWGGTLWEAGYSVGMLDELVVDESWRGKGVGDRLVTEIVAFARTRGLHSVQLMTAGHREAAHRFYEKRGFELRGTKVFRYLVQT